MPTMNKCLTANTAVAVVILCLSIGAPQSGHAAGGGGGGGFSSAPAPSRALTPEEQSDKLMNSGIRHRDRALKQEAKAAKAAEAGKDKARDKALAKAEKEFQKAITKQGEAIQVNPKNYKAANELGYALRKIGEFRKAIGAYNYSLKLKPDYHEAIEYRAEALLALGYLEETKGEYLRLFRNNRPLADQLMQAIEQWMNGKGEELSEDEAAFVDWVEERRRLAGITTDLSMHNTRAWPH